MSDTILRTRNYYSGIDQRHYYKSDGPDVIPLNLKATRATKHKDVYLSDLLNNPDCSVSFGVYRDTDNPSAPMKISDWNDIKTGTVISYNPATNLLGIDCVKKRPSRVSRLFKRTNKVRYVEPDSITVSSISRDCWLRLVPERASRSSPKDTSSPKETSSPKSASRASFRGGKRTRRRRVFFG